MRTGQEQVIADKCQSLISKDVLEECVVLHYEHMKKYQGRWHKEEKVLFPGYLFMVTNKVDELYVNLKKISDFIKLLGESEIFPIYKEEVLHLLKYSDKHLIEMSKGIESLKGIRSLLKLSLFDRRMPIFSIEKRIEILSVYL